MTNFDSLYDDVAQLWPSRIDISERIFNDNDTIRYPELDDIHDAIEQELKRIDNALLFVMDWVFYKSFHALAQFECTLRIGDLDKGQLKRMFEKDLFSTPELESVRKLYE